MSARLAEAAAKLESTRQIGSVIGAMRAIAASRSQQARRELGAIRQYAATIGGAIGQVLAALPTDHVSSTRPQHPDGTLVVALCAEQGFVGAFNERMLDVALPLAAQAPSRLFVVGYRGQTAAASRGHTPEWSTSMAARTAEVPALADRLADAVHATLAARALRRVLLVHGSPDEGGSFGVVQRWLLPFDFARFSGHERARAGADAPLTNLPPALLLEQLAVEYMRADLCEALILSYAAENQARMQAMIAAHSNIERNETRLTLEYQRVRQEDVTDEILELSAARL